MNEDFVLRDVHDIEIRRIDEKIEATVSRMEQKLDSVVERMERRFDYVVDRMELKMDAHMAQVNGVIAKMEGRLDAMDAKISNISRNVALIMTIFGLVLSGISMYFSMR